MGNLFLINQAKHRRMTHQIPENMQIPLAAVSVKEVISEKPYWVIVAVSDP